MRWLLWCCIAGGEQNEQQLYSGSRVSERQNWLLLVMAFLLG